DRHDPERKLSVMLTDAQLVERVIAGFDDAFDELYRRHANSAWRLAQAVTNNSHDAADAVSEAFARVLQAVRAGRLEDGGAVRPRAGLRERYLQAHVRNHAEPRCKFTVEHLGAYVAGAISPRDLAKVDQHLAGCEDCRARKEELEDLGTTLRRVAFPLPLAL